MLSKSDFISEDEIIRVLGILDDMPLKIRGRNVEHISVEIGFLPFGLLQLFNLEKLYAREAKYEDMKVDTMDGKN